VSLLRETGSLREGHFEYPDGMHSNEYLQIRWRSGTISTPAR